jgi:hypothetical protein
MIKRILIYIKWYREDDHAKYQVSIVRLLNLYGALFPKLYMWESKRMDKKRERDKQKLISNNNT